MITPTVPVSPQAFDWWVPDWPAPPGTRALCTTRSGGFSVGTGYASMNLGSHVGDAADLVASNRQRLREVAGARPVFLQQVHGVAVQALDPHSPDGLVGDACFTQASGVACTVMVADCLPVLICDRQGRAVGAAHCGWRSLANGVLEQLYQSFVDSGATPTASSLLAWLGPCIGPTAFEVGDEVRAAFMANDARAARCFQPHTVPGKWWADLPALARQRLQALGFAPHQIFGNDGSSAWCTVSNASTFFSFRRDGSASGRFAAVIWRD